MDVWFTSDHHFGHKNILKYESIARPFSTIEQMNEVLIERWNGLVKDNDIVFHLGDFAFGRHNLIRNASRLRGKKRLVMGNHDTYASKLYLEYFDKLYGVVFYDRCILSHMPLSDRNLGSRWLLNVHGHLHSKIVHTNSVPDMNYFNVSVEQNNLTPIHRDVIMDRLRFIE